MFKMPILIKESRSLILLGVLFSLLAGCRSATTLYFYPHKVYVNDPAKHGIDYTEVSLSTKDGETLANWLFKPEGETKGRVVFFHGNAENISTHFASVYWLPKYGYEVLLVDYRGYGKSTGTPVLPEVFDDMKLAYQWLNRQSSEDGLPVYVFGQSIGAALTVIAMAELEQQPECLILDAGFASFKEMARMSFQNSWLVWPFAYPASWLVPDEYEPQDYAEKLTGNVLQFHSKSDSIVPYAQGQALKDRIKKGEWVESEGRHITTFNHLVNREKVVKFFDDCH